MKNKKLLKVLLAVLAVVVAGVVYTMLVQSEGDASAEVLLTEETGESSDEDESAEQEDPENETSAPDTADQEELCVHVCGCVNSPGVYFLAGGSRVYQALEAAGGLTDEAAGWYVNQAAYLADGDQIYIPSEDEVESGDIPEVASSSADSESDGLININTATAEELQALSGIGEARAEAIIAYREENGDFSSVEDITNVSGIGDSIYEQIKDKIKV